MQKKPNPLVRSSKPLLSKLAQQILAYVSDNGIQTNAHLGEEKLAQQFKVSRTPVRSALEFLAGIGIVEKRPNLGYFLIAESKSLALKPLVEEDPDDVIYFQIVEDRLSKRLPDKLPEQELMRRYALTKTRLTGLLRRMSQEGWISRLPGNGWEFLPVLESEEAYDQGFQFRVLVEPAALLQETFYLAPGDIGRLRSQQQAMLDGGILRYSRAEMFQIGAQFHESIVAASGNPFFVDAIRRINNLRRLLDYRTHSDRARLVTTCKEHLELLTLIEARKLKQASNFLRAHIERERLVKSPLTRHVME